MKIYFFLLFVALLAPKFVDALPRRNRNEPDCSQYEDGETLPDSSSCSKYYMCINGKALRKHCARGLYYDVMAGLCNRAFLVNCQLNRLGKDINDIVQNIPDFNLEIELDLEGDSPEPQAVTVGTKTPSTCTTTPCTTTTSTCTTTTSTCTTTTSTCTTTTSTCTTTTSTCTTTTSTCTTTTSTCTTTTSTCTTTTSTCTTTTPTCTTTTCTTPKITTRNTPKITTGTTTTCTTPKITTCTTPKITTCTTPKITTGKTTTCTTPKITTCTTTTCTTSKITTPKITTCTTPKITTPKITTCSTTTCTTKKPTCTTTTCTTKKPTCTTTTCATTKKSIIGHKTKTLHYLSSSKDCLDLTDGTILLDFNHCRRYYTCSNRRVKRNRCSVGNWFDQETRSCRPRGSVTNCMANRN